MKLTEEQYAKLWHHHRALEIERSSKKGKDQGERVTRAAVRKFVSSGKWFTIEEVANRLKCDMDTIEGHVNVLRQAGLIMMSHSNGYSCFKLKDGLR